MIQMSQDRKQIFVCPFICIRFTIMFHFCQTFYQRRIPSFLLSHEISLIFPPWTDFMWTWETCITIHLPYFFSFPCYFPTYHFSFFSEINRKCYSHVKQVEHQYEQRLTSDLNSSCCYFFSHLPGSRLLAGEVWVCIEQKEMCRSKTTRHFSCPQCLMTSWGVCNTKWTFFISTEIL